jgi:hypothetical protein
VVNSLQPKLAKPVPASSNVRRHVTNPWQQNFYQTVAAEVSALSRYCDRLIQWRPNPADPMLLFNAIDCSVKQLAQNVSDIPDFSTHIQEKVVILINGNLNYELDIQDTLQQLKPTLSRSSRVVAVLYNPYFAWLYKLANKCGIRRGELPCTFVTEVDLRNLATLSGYELVRLRNSCICPFQLFGLGALLNKIIPAMPYLRWLSLSVVAFLRPIIREAANPSLSIVVPARNERGNIENVIRRLECIKDFDFEVLFVEGNSTDETWDEIQRVTALYKDAMNVRALKQTGHGKSDGVRLAFAEARNELLVILDADLSVPPELLERFYAAYCEGLGDFINGSRLVYPIQGRAMKFLNKVGNVFFAKLLSRVLGCSISDSLCGTKLFSRDEYKRMCLWRKDFGECDPFGDFELLFPAAQLAMRIIDVPIHYRDRVYGETNIRRFHHGLMLLKMMLIGFFKITLPRTDRIG